ncbi:hypothetical protein DYU11_03310 [Fibrisoma montanum]|uniref:Uncharacterized protein n=1 Tax=Fibrisoma montanum TaxID=2305895 RepID=A0A418MIW2_9BACT|nr:hypothetical protein [Fibrisoma montanum]RIV27354.1 hypothetical protein DYU11_03310 [Fibrisoma montanum]
MTAELAQVMDHTDSNKNFALAIEHNVAGKRTQANRQRSYIALRKLYRFDTAYLPFAALFYFWKLTEPQFRPKLAFLYALGHDYLLSESFSVITNTPLGASLSVTQFQSSLANHHPNQFSEVTQYSIAKNLASSYKQVGYLVGKVKAMRIPFQSTLPVVTFAFLMAYINGDRGEYLLGSIWVKALEQDADTLHHFLVQASHKGWLTYQRAGSVMSISFESLIQEITAGNGHQD